MPRTRTPSRVIDSRQDVREGCKAEIRAWAERNRVDPEDVFDRLFAVRHEQRRKTIRQVDRAGKELLAELAGWLSRARKALPGHISKDGRIFAGGGDVIGGIKASLPSFELLRRAVCVLEDLSEVETPPAIDDEPLRRRVILAEFDKPHFLGRNTKARATDRELAMVSIYVDDDIDLNDRRSIRTFYDVIKNESDAIGKLRSRPGPLKAPAKPRHSGR